MNTIIISHFVAVSFIIFISIFVVACGAKHLSDGEHLVGNGYNHSEMIEENSNSVATPEPTPDAIPAPTLMPTLESTLIPTPEPTQANATFPFPFRFSAVDLHGNSITEETLGEMEAFFVYYWTTWCISCVEGMPDLAQLAQSYVGRVGFISLLGDFETARDTAIRITNHSGIPFITVDANHYELQSLMVMLDSGFVPTSVIIGRDGNVIGSQIVGSGIDRFQLAIENAFNE
jgi:thiol-disulfide isomerase/thioredoxin